MAFVTEFSSLHEIQRWWIQSLRDAAINPDSAFRWPVLATSDGAGKPSARTVVLRGYDADRRHAKIYSDIRTQKIRDLSASDCVALVFFDPKTMVQIRASGIATLQTGAQATETLGAIAPKRRRDYASIMAPGAPSSTYESPIDLDLAEANFCIISVRIDSVDVLSLDRSAHQRARFIWNEPDWDACWLTP